MNNGTITANNWGTTIITANVNGKTASCEVTVPQILTGVSLNQTAITIENGDTYQLEATSSYRTVYNWSSSNTSVATVDSNGLVTAVGPGSAVISVAQGEYGATCAVIVTQKLTGISLSSSSLTLNEGASSTLTVSYSPSNTTDNKTVTWISSDTSVATVSNGKVTAVKAGSTTITATVGSYSKTCTVTVKAPLTGISLNKTSTTLNIGGTETLTVTYTPSNTTDSKTVTWTSSNTSVATVSNGKITAVGAGTATITATVGSYSKTCTVTVNKISISSVPSQSGTLTYTGSAQSPTWNNYDSSKLTIGGTTSSTNAGTYTATFTPKSGYQWSDGTTTAKSVNWTINKATNPLSLSASSGTIWCCAVIDDFGNVEYEGNDSFTVSNPSGGELSITCSDYNAIYTQRFESTVYIYSGTYSEAKTYSVTVTSAETTNYKAGSATYLVRIQYSGAC